ncbi:MAG: AmmeMemoRadiSam system radical SAM enzyme [Firmicutes bacterium]|nr:AmmeMemoRadiSam system radical SAM enzyme [Bacillota bacterium]
MFNGEINLEASYCELLPQSKISCLLCPQGCIIPPQGKGFCKVRLNREGKLIAANYARITGIAVDPIEKKPLYHFYPGQAILSVGTIGCNLGCEFCQNWQISKEDGAPAQRMEPEALVELAVRARRESGSVGLAYTYTEPGVWFEFLQEIMPRIRERGLKNILVTNGFLNPDPWKKLLGWTDAANIDLKGFTNEFYQKYCHGKLEPVKANIEAAVGKIHVELTNLIIPGANDQPEEIRAMAQWIAGLDPEIPLHLSRYFPNYRLATPATSVATMEQAYQIAKEYLDYVYLGNMGAHNDTRCPQCGEILVKRAGYSTKVLIEDPSCRKCGREIPIKGIKKKSEA